MQSMRRGQRHVIGFVLGIIEIWIHISTLFLSFYHLLSIYYACLRLFGVCCTSAHKEPSTTLDQTLPTTSTASSTTQSQIPTAHAPHAHTHPSSHPAHSKSRPSPSPPQTARNRSSDALANPCRAHCPRILLLRRLLSSLKQKEMVS